MAIPVTLITGYLGAGKTTIIINLVEQFQPGYKSVWLKNEYGDVNIDKVLAGEKNIETKEIMNGCLCCVQVGRLHDAINEIVKEYTPDRIIIESSGTAYPLPITLELERIPEVYVDGVVTVVDALNFTGYHDKGEIARMQTAVTDLILINKSGMVDENRLDEVKDLIYDVYPHTPQVLTNTGKVSPDLILGIDHKTISDLRTDYSIPDTVSITPHQHDDDVQTFTYNSDQIFNKSQIEQVLSPLKNKDYLRIKGVVKTEDGYYLMNWVFGKISWQKLEKYDGPTEAGVGETQIVFMAKDISNRAMIEKQLLRVVE